MILSVHHSFANGMRNAIAAGGKSHRNAEGRAINCEVPPSTLLLRYDNDMFSSALTGSSNAQPLVREAVVPYTKRDDDVVVCCKRRTTD